MLDITKVELELISDADMYLFFEKFMGGGVIFLMTENKSQKIFFFGCKLFMTMQFLDFFRKVNSNGLFLKIFI